MVKIELEEERMGRSPFYGSIKGNKSATLGCIYGWVIKAAVLLVLSCPASIVGSSFSPSSSS